MKMKTKNNLISFKSEGRFKIDNDHMFGVRLDRDCFDFSHLLGENVLIDGNEKKVTGVENFTITPPYRKGSPICLRVKNFERRVTTSANGTRSVNFREVLKRQKKSGMLDALKKVKI